MAQSNTVPTCSYPLAYDANAQPLALPPEAIKFYVKETTRGRPRVVYDKETGKQAELELTATLVDLRQIVPGPGQYRLQPVDASERELTPVAHVEIVPDGALESLSPPYMDEATSRGDRMHEIVDRLFAQRDAHDLMQADLLKTLITTTACIQQSTAQLLTAANTTIRIANGVEALERQDPIIDVEALSTQLSEMLAAQGADTSQTPWFMQLLNSPLGTPLGQLLSGFVSTLAAAQAPAAPKPAAPAPAAAQAPQQPPPPAAAVSRQAEPANDAAADAELPDGADEEHLEPDEPMDMNDAGAGDIKESLAPPDAKAKETSEPAASHPPEAAMRSSDRASQGARQEARRTEPAKSPACRARKAARKRSRKHRHKRR